MKRVILWMVSIGLVSTLPFLTGCFTSGSFNPVADTSLAQANTVAPNVAGTINAAKVKPGSSPSRKYTFAAPPHSICQRLREGTAHAKGFLKIWLQSLTTADHIYITVDQIRVKPRSGKFMKLAIPAREIDLLQAADVSQVVGELSLPSGIYTHLEFMVSNPKLVLNGKQEKMIMLGNRVHFAGKFEIKDGYRTNLTLRFLHKMIRTRGFLKKDLYWFVPVVKISSTLTPVEPPPSVVDGDVNLSVLDFVKKTPLAGVTATLEGTAFSGTTDASGLLSFLKVPAGTYNLKLTHPDYLDKAFQVTVSAGQITDAVAEMNPTVIYSNVANTGWFSQRYPYADANGLYGEVAMETPVTIDFVSLNFVKAEVAFEGEYQQSSAGDFAAYISASQQVSALTNLGTWWVGNSATLGSLLGTLRATSPATPYKFDVTEFVRSNPNSMYFLAARNYSLVNMRMNNIQLTIYYK